MIVDAHSDLLMELVHAEDTLRERNPMRARWLPPLRDGGVGLQVCALYVDPDLDPGVALRALLRQVHAFHAGVSANPDGVFAVERAADLDALGRGRVGLLLALEGASPLAGDGWLIDVLARLGVRMAGLTWNERNAFAAGCDHDEGLTPLGAELVDRMRERGIVIDLAHASPRTAADVLERVGATPVVASHTACRALYDHPRNLDDEQLRAVAEHGGVVGMMPHPYVLGADATMRTFLDHIDHAVSVAGVEHVGLGGDFLRQIARSLGIDHVVEDGIAMDAALDGLEGPQDYPALAAALRERGYAGGDLAALLGGNLVRVLRAVLR